MIELVLADRCIGCDICVRVCPTNVFDPGPDGIPTIARQADCQTCFMCELYCPTDALYVAADCETPTEVDAGAIAATDWPGQYRRDSGWGRWRHTNRNESWRMELIFQAAFALVGVPWPGEAQPTRTPTDQPDEG